MTRESIEVTRQDRIYCLKVSSDYHSEVCEECKFYPNCDHMTQDDMTELTIKDLEVLEQEPKTVLYIGDGYADGYMVYDMAECPNCGYEYEDSDKDWGLPFCPSCGQKLNWESEE
jgi:hypothetical protein